MTIRSTVVGRIAGLFDRRDALFALVHRQNLWGSAETVSGPGSTVLETVSLRAALPRLINDLGITTFLDIPCGDFHWMRLTDLPVDHYIGADVVDDLIRANALSYATPTREFVRCDIVRDRLPSAEIVFCRDLLVHLSHRHVVRALANVKRSNAKWLMTTTFCGDHAYRDIRSGDWRPINFRLPPFNFPEPKALIVENCQYENGRWADKAMAVWPVSVIPY